jgi:CMP-N,N'-diacetyllegionaminic acid synthase
MYNNKKFLAIIPARGGSTRLPKKNLKMLLGKPLVKWTIDDAKKSKILDRIILSTDDSKIKEIGEKSKIEIHHRSPELSSETSLIIDTLYDVSKNNAGFDILYLNPTSPIRQKGLIDTCIKKFVDKKFDAVASGIIAKYVKWPTNMKRTQDLEGYFIDNGAVYVYNESLIRRKTLLSKKFGTVLVDKSEYVDIDDEFDFKMAEVIMKYKIEKETQEESKI